MITIYHNPQCGTSRNTLALLREKGLKPTIVDYKAVGWTRPLLEKILTQMGAKPRDILRARGTLAEELGLLDPKCGDDKILAAMIEHPILVERPIVVTPKGAVLCRPMEKVLTVL
jgi:arsenate reductase